MAYTDIGAYSSFADLYDDYESKCGGDGVHPRREDDALWRLYQDLDDSYCLFHVETQTYFAPDGWWDVVFDSGWAYCAAGHREAIRWAKRYGALDEYKRTPE